MKKVTTTIEMDINTAVDFALAKISSGYKAFFINTQFGRIPVEVVKGVYKMYPTGVYGWNSSVLTNFIAENRHGNYKWYVQINYVSGQKEILTKMQLIREFSKILYAELNGKLPSDEVAYALTEAFLKDYCGVDKYWMKEEFLNEYVRLNTNTSLIKGFNKSVKENLKREVERSASVEDRMSTEIIRNAYSVVCKSSSLDADFRQLDYFYTILLGISANVPDEKYREAYRELTKDDGCISAFDLVKGILNYSSNK